MTYQLTAPLLDACVLGVVENEDVYGYTLTQRVMDVVDISESTLYPVLRRLQKSGLLTTYDKPYQGRNRRYYSITAEGSRQLQFFRNEWEIYKDKINQLIDPASHAQADLLSMMNPQTVTGTANGNEISLTLYSGYKTPDNINSDPAINAEIPGTAEDPNGNT
ncbi:MAG: PadR family transcriptional regulator [Lachnospiraceae bacterium]|nr:PadR family transcriptional regulator [Lachnospiraceae bacterium]